jgi:hypothetical protein
MNEIKLYDIGVAFPICAICDKPVDKVESMYLPDYDGKVFRVYCHGKVEQQILSSFVACEANQITFGKAFDYPKLHNINKAAEANGEEL